MTINIREELSTGPIDVVITTSDECSSIWTITVSTASPIWVEWILSDGDVVITRQDMSPFVNGETISSDTVYIGTITNFRSPRINDFLSSIIVRTRVSDGGSILNQTQLFREHTGLYCL